jgi:hypothetical protein
VRGWGHDQALDKGVLLSIMEHRGSAEHPLAVELRTLASEGVLPFNASSLVSNKPVSLTCGESDDC